jgi:hypothetical protein
MLVDECYGGGDEGDKTAVMSKKIIRNLCDYTFEVLGAWCSLQYLREEIVALRKAPRFEQHQENDVDAKGARYNTFTVQHPLCRIEYFLADSINVNRGMNITLQYRDLSDLKIFFDFNFVCRRYQ